MNEERPAGQLPRAVAGGAPRAVQFFSDEYLERCREFTPAQIARFLDEFRRNFAAAEASRKRQPEPVAPGNGERDA